MFSLTKVPENPLFIRIVRSVYKKGEADVRETLSVPSTNALQVTVVPEINFIKQVQIEGIWSIQ